MPISLRTVEPVDVSLNRLPLERTRDELQCVANGTLTNLIRQLTSLSIHGEQLFADMHQNVAGLNRKLDDVVLRTARLNDKLNKGAGQQAGGRLAENNLRKAYRSQNALDQHSLSRQTLPRAMVELYDRCDPPPDLNLLNEFRDDPKPALKFYTDPGYFFELWKQEILKECAVDKRLKMARSPAQPAHAAAGGLAQSQQQREVRRADSSAPTARRPVHSSRTLLNHYADQGGLGLNSSNLVQFPTEYQAPQISRYVAQQPPPGMSRPLLMRPSAAAPPLPDQFEEEPLPPPPAPAAQRSLDPHPTSSPSSALGLAQELQAKAVMSPAGDSFSSSAAVSTAQQLPNIDDEEDELPPPPPPLSSHTTMNLNMQYLAPAASQAAEPAPANGNHHHPAGLPPAPAIPSSSTSGAIHTVMTESVVQSSFVAQVRLAGEEGADPTSTGQAAQAAAADAEEPSAPNSRSNLLLEIQSGFKLRKVQRREEVDKAKAAAESNDVAAILRRRMEHVLGNDDSDEEDAGSQDDSEWDEH